MPFDQAIELVRGFHRHIGAPISEAPTLPTCDRAIANEWANRLFAFSNDASRIGFATGDVVAQRLAMALEEMGEELRGISEGSILALADAWADRAVLLIGDAVASGLPASELFLEVSRSNLSKEIAGMNGKAVKGAGYFRPNIASEITAHFPEIKHWVIGGHSVGGTMAAQYTRDHPEIVDGLVIWASYPADNADLSRSGLPVGSIYGSLDPRVNDSSVAERRHLLPDDTSYTRIGGGDHHHFGSYEIEPSDHHATLRRADQQEQIIQATLGLLDSVSTTTRE